MDFVEKILDAIIAALAGWIVNSLPKIIQRLKTNPHPQIPVLRDVYGSVSLTGTATMKCNGTVTEPVWFDGIGDKS